MTFRISMTILGVLILFLGYVATRDGHFHYERSGLIKAPPEKIFPYLSNFKLGAEWSPYEKVDPNMKKTFVGPEAQVGSIMEFDGNSEAGSGKLELLKIVPNEMVQIRLTMTKPLPGENLIEYRLTPEAEGTRFTWGMSGDGGFVGKLMSVLIDCEKMIGGHFSAGIANLKELIESSK